MKGPEESSRLQPGNFRLKNHAGLYHACIFWAACIHLTPAFLQGTAAAGFLEWSLSAGQTYEYLLEYHSISDTDFQALFEEPADSSGEDGGMTQSGMIESHATSVRGLWTMTVIENAGGRIILSHALAESFVSLELNGSEAQDLALQTAADLGLAFLTEMNAQGRILRVYLDPNTSDLARHYARTLLAKSQFVPPSEPVTGDGSWESEEEDLNGTYKALYEPLSPLFLIHGKELHSDQKAFRKSRLKYFSGTTNPGSGRKALQATIKPEGCLKAVFNIRGGFLESIEGLEKEQIFIAGKKVSDVESRFLLHLARRDSVGPEDLDSKRKDFEDRKKNVNPIVLSEPVSEEKAERAIQRSALGEETLESLFAELEKAEAAGEERNTDLYLKFNPSSTAIGIF